MIVIHGLSRGVTAGSLPELRKPVRFNVLMVYLGRGVDREFESPDLQNPFYYPPKKVTPHGKRGIRNPKRSLFFGLKLLSRLRATCTSSLSIHWRPDRMENM
jgi:hypothetical protein